MRTFVAKRREIVLTLQESHVPWLNLEHDDDDSAAAALQVPALWATLDW